MIYCIDTSSLTRAARDYPQEIFPRVWQKLEEMVEAETLISTEQVMEELERKEGDFVHEWAKNRAKMFRALNKGVQEKLELIINQFPQCVDSRTGKNFADPWVIATAVVEGCTVVTNELATNSLTRPKIPDICRELSVRCIDLITMLREQRATFG